MAIDIGIEPIFPSAKDAKFLAEPEKAYDQTLYYLSLAPRIDGSKIDYTLSLMARPARILSDGQIEIAPDTMTTIRSVGSVTEKAQDAVGQLALQIVTLLHDME
jgi:hypothetical protein